jgi:hypothetical protein
MQDTYPGSQSMGRRKWLLLGGATLWSIALWRRKPVAPSTGNGFVVVNGWILPATYFATERA